MNVPGPVWVHELVVAAFGVASALHVAAYTWESYMDTKGGGQSTSPSTYAPPAGFVNPETTPPWGGHAAYNPHTAPTGTHPKFGVNPPESLVTELRNAVQARNHRRVQSAYYNIVQYETDKGFATIQVENWASRLPYYQTLLSMFAVGMGPNN